MRLLFIANDFPNPLNPTGAVFNLQLAKALSHRHQIQVISPVSWVDELHAWRAGHGKLPPGRRMNFQGVDVFYPRYYYPPKYLRTYYGWFYWQSIAAVAQKVIQGAGGKFDAVLAYWVHPDGEAAVRVARAVGAPSAVIAGGSDVQIITADPHRRRSVVNVLQSVDTVITVNQDLKHKVEAMGIPSDKVQVWTQGVDSAHFYPGDRLQARKKLGIDEQGPVMLWVGRMVPVKGLEVLVEACAQLHKKRADFTVYLVGDGPLRGALEKSAEEKGLRNRVKFVGARPPEQLGDWYRAADLFLMSSWSEGLPNVLRESLACGTPFVSSKVGGIAEISGERDRLFPAGNSTAMAEAIDQSMAFFGTPPRVPDNAPPSWDLSAELLLSLICHRVKPYAIVQHNLGAIPARAGKGMAVVRQLIRRAVAATIPRKLLIMQGSAKENKVCLTFDDGPDPRQTPLVLDILKNLNAKATFFVVGYAVADHLDLIRRIIAEGHALGHHTYSHSLPEKTSARKLMYELAQTDDVLRPGVSKSPSLFRPPFGRLTFAKCFSLWMKGKTIVLWNRDPKDYMVKSVSELRRQVTQYRPSAGDIVLMHDRIPATVEVLPELIQIIRGAGLGFATVDDWVKKESIAAPMVSTQAVPAVYGSSQPQR